MMFDLARLKIDLEKAIKMRDDFEMKGSDTPYLTYHEQLDLYNNRIEILKKRIKEIMQ